MAPDANIVAEKVLNAKGTGYNTDIASGIIKATDAGASVINISITYFNDAATVAAINYAASKGAFLVWAGGNDSQSLLAGANTTGLTTTALTHMIFAGAVTSTNARASFSNIPGRGNLVASGTTASYMSRWVMAPGQSILAPASPTSTSLSSWSGTSMAAPIVSGSLILLESAWPILKTRGTLADLLLATATDLGTAGVDSTYGRGLINLTTAFSPYGPLTVTNNTGGTIPVTSLSGTLATGSLGSLPNITALLNNYTALDSYLRNFTVNLSGLIRTPLAPYQLNALPTNIRTPPSVMRWSDGSDIAIMTNAAPVDVDKNFDVTGSRTENVNSQFFMMLSDKAGDVKAMGLGVTSRMGYANALYHDKQKADLSMALGSSNLSDISNGGTFISWGSSLNPSTRFAISLNEKNNSALSGNKVALNNDSKNAVTDVNVGLLYAMNDSIQLGLHLDSLTEEKGLLGNLYETNALINLGNKNYTSAIGFSLNIDIDKNQHLLLEGTNASIKSSRSSGIVNQTNGISAQALGVAYLHNDLIKKDDVFTLSIKQPLRVAEGKANVTLTEIDAVTGEASQQNHWVSLKPDGHEIDSKLSYNTPLTQNQNIAFEASYIKDGLNIKDNDFTKVGIIWNIKF